MNTSTRSTTLFSSLMFGVILQLIDIAPLQAQNLVTNSSFASGSSSGWSTSSSLEINPQTIYGGPSSSIYVTELDMERTINQEVCILPGLTYTLSYQATRRPQIGSPAKPGIQVKVTGTSTNTNYVNIAQLYSNTTWDAQTKTLSIAIPSNSTDKKLNIQFQSYNNSTTYGVLVWDVQLSPSATSPLTISGPSSSAVAAGNSYSLTNSPASAAYNWSFSGGASQSSSTSTNPSNISWASTGAKTVSVSVSNGTCTMASYSKTVSVQTTLPVNITGFTGTIAGDAGQLTWVAEKETNGKYYVVERSADGIDFDSIGKVNSANAAMAYTYHYPDPSLAAGNNFYRIRHVDLDGAIYYSRIIVLNNASGNSNGQLQVYPNPATSTLNYSIVNAKAGSFILQVYNTSGVMVLSSYVELPAGSTQRTLSIAQLGKGNYFLRLADAQGSSRYALNFVKI